jgi:acetyl esterase/lipase
MSMTPDIPQSVRDLMAEIGPKWATNTSGHVKMMVDAFSAVLASVPTDDLEVTPDIVYGHDDERQVLDVWRKPGVTGAPMFLFFHGGAFTDGDKNRTPQIHGNIVRHAARNGIIGINVEYRQAPKWGYPAGSVDVGLAVAWARANAAQVGGDPDRIFICGSSAGAAHTGSYAYDKRLQPAGGPGIAGHIVLSGRVRADNRPDNPNARRVEAYYGTDASRFDDLSCVSHAAADSVPTFIAVAEYENPLIDVYCAELFYRLSVAKGASPRFMRLVGHNHASIHAHIGTSENVLGQELIDFMRTGR